MTIYTVEEPPQKSRLRRTGRVFGWIGLVLVMLAGGFAGGTYLWLHESVAALNLTGPGAKHVRGTLLPPGPNQPAIWLALGYDHRAGQGTDPSRSDTIMLLRTDPKTKTVSMLSFPRDLQVPIHCSGHSVWTDKINAAFSCGSQHGGPSAGAAAALDTVKALTNLPINYLITVDFFGFKKIVNILGGVWVDVDRRYFNNQGGPNGYATINLQPGYQKLTGGAALSFVRYRHTDSDIVRTARQQLFLQALKQQFSHSVAISDIPHLVNAAADNVKIGFPGSQSSSLDFLQKYAVFARDLRPGGYCQAQIAGLTGYSDVTAPAGAVQSAVQQFLTPCVKAAGQANAAALNLKVKTHAPAVPKPAQTSIVVLNGNGVAGAAADANYRLLQRGYRMNQPVGGQAANAPSRVFHTQIYYQSWSKRGKAAAGSLAQVMAPADVKIMPANLRSICGGGVMLCIVVGTTYHNALTPPPAAQPVIKHHPPSVYNDSSATRPLALQAQRSVPFPVLVPNVLESTSSPDTYGGDPPLRVYHITDKFKAARFVFRLGSGANYYWGIEETNWKGAPVLSDTNYHRVIGGRSYSFYYHGAHLHMVVLHVGATDYWVVNTLLDSLSNETMIAIAKGLQPLSTGHAKSTTKK